MSNVNYHKTESIKTQIDDLVVQSIIVSDKVTENRGALIFGHIIISKHPQNMCFHL